MMKNQLLFIFCIHAFGLLNAQWTTDGSNIYNSNPNNVGVGSIVPNAKLHVGGSPSILQFLVQPSSTGNAFAKIASNGNGHAYLNVDANYASYINFLSGGVSKWQIGRPAATYDFSIYNSNLNNTSFFIQSSTGNVSIGSQNTIEKLTLEGNMRITGPTPYLQISDRLVFQLPMAEQNSWSRSIMGQNIRWNAASTKWSIIDKNYSDFAMIRFDNQGAINFFTKNANSQTSDMSNEELEAFKRFTINYNGDVGIGTSDTKGYRLAVNGNAIFTKVKVKQYGSWPDYVFDPEYKLLSLPEIDKYIQQHKHLPGIPSAFEIEKNGLDLGENQALLLKKIEELTLYLIEMRKENEMINKKIEEQRNEIMKLKRIIK